MNKVFLAGRLVNEPTETISSRGTPFSRNTLAIRSNGRNGITQFVNFVAFGNTANFLNSYLHKGDFVIIEGRLDVQKYVSSEGRNMSSISVVVDSITPTPGNRTNNNFGTSTINYQTKKVNVKNNDEEFVSVDDISLSNDNEVFEIPDDQGDVFKTSTFSVKKPDDDYDEGSYNSNNNDNDDNDDLFERQEWENDLED